MIKFKALPKNNQIFHRFYNNRWNHGIQEVYPNNNFDQQFIRPADV